jgi:hypothetical protein
MLSPAVATVALILTSMLFGYALAIFIDLVKQTHTTN